MFPYLALAFCAGLATAVPLSFWLSRGFRFVWRMPAWRMNPESLGAETSATSFVSTVKEPVP